MKMANKVIVGKRKNFFLIFVKQIYLNCWSQLNTYSPCEQCNINKLIVPSCILKKDYFSFKLQILHKVMFIAHVRILLFTQKNPEVNAQKLFCCHRHPTIINRTVVALRLIPPLWNRTRRSIFVNKNTKNIQTLFRYNFI